MLTLIFVLRNRIYELTAKLRTFRLFFSLVYFRWTSWTDWSACEPCVLQENGTHTRSRDCDAVPDSDTVIMNGTKICDAGDREEVTEICSCPYEWSQWSTCNCDTGVQKRNR